MYRQSYKTMKINNNLRIPLGFILTSVIYYLLPMVEPIDKWLTYHKFDTKSIFFIIGILGTVIYVAFLITTKKPTKLVTKIMIAVCAATITILILNIPLDLPLLGVLTNCIFTLLAMIIIVLKK